MELVLDIGVRQYGIDRVTLSVGRAEATIIRR